MVKRVFTSHRVKESQLTDTIAKKTVQDTDISSFSLPLPASHLKNKLKNDWQRRRQNDDTNRYTHNLLPNVPIEFPVDNRYLFLFCTNHGTLQKYLYGIGKRDSPLCVCDLPSTLIDCTMFWTVLWRIGSNLFSSSDIIGITSSALYIGRYIKKWIAIDWFLRNQPKNKFVCLLFHTLKIQNSVPDKIKPPPNYVNII